jgi:hypothetical protein
MQKNSRWTKKAIVSAYMFEYGYVEADFMVFNQLVLFLHKWMVYFIYLIF